MTKPRLRHEGQTADIVQPLYLSAAFWRRWDEVFGETSTAEREQIGDDLAILAHIHHDSPLGSQGVRFELENMAAIDSASGAGASELTDWYARRCHDSTRAVIDQARHSAGSLLSGDIGELHRAVLDALSVLARGDRGQPKKRRELVADYARRLIEARGLTTAAHRGSETSKPAPMVELLQLCLEATEGRRPSLDVAYRALKATT